MVLSTKTINAAMKVKLALIIESKIASPLTNYQLQRHTNGVRARRIYR